MVTGRQPIPTRATWYSWARQSISGTATAIVVATGRKNGFRRHCGATGGSPGRKRRSTEGLRQFGGLIMRAVVFPRIVSGGGKHCPAP